MPDAKTNPDNAKPEDAITFSDFATFTDQVFQKMDERDRKLLEAIKGLLSDTMGAYDRQSKRDDLQDRRLDRIEQAMGLLPLTE